MSLAPKHHVDAGERCGQVTRARIVIRRLLLSRCGRFCTNRIATPVEPGGDQDQPPEQQQSLEHPAENRPETIWQDMMSRWMPDEPSVDSPQA